MTGWFALLTVLLFPLNLTGPDRFDSLGAITMCAVSWPSNIQVSRDLDSTLDELLAGSPSFVAQCERLARQRRLDIRVRLVPSMPREYYALSDIHRNRDGHLAIDIRISARSDYALALVHEFEHVLEQLDGWDLPELARQGGTGVRKLHNGAFETRRAIEAGRRARRELNEFGGLVQGTE